MATRNPIVECVIKHISKASANQMWISDVHHSQFLVLNSVQITEFSTNPMTAVKLSLLEP